MTAPVASIGRPLQRRVIAAATSPGPSPLAVATRVFPVAITAPAAVAARVVAPGRRAAREVAAGGRLPRAVAAAGVAGVDGPAEAAAQEAVVVGAGAAGTR
ncbi:MAG: hypothetical protein AUI36_12350 [Cyanobacteria bacterium 13_1_40CM_2_61_4]|nr:MAG: hypothetical protein AUI36_12350 [Cyanobacteria bacterium 13_1_40CM_2_61_4]